MPSIKTGTFTIKQVIQLTYESPYRNRFEYRKRDKINLVRIRRIKQFNPQDLNHPTYLIEAYSQSTPNYSPYLTKRVTKTYRKGSKTYERKEQRYYKNCYDIFFRIWNPSGNINSKQWAIRLGSDKLFKKYPKKMIKSKKNPHGKFLSNGHANAVLRGINADFCFRTAYWLRYYGHGYQMNHIGYKEPKKIKQLFLVKHLINFFDLLLQAKILVDEPLQAGEI